MPSLKGPILGLIIAPILTFGAYMTAVEIEHGVRHEYTGRRAGVKMLFAWIAESLGSTGVIVAGGLICAGMVAWLILTLKKRASVRKA